MLFVSLSMRRTLLLFPLALLALAAVGGCRSEQASIPEPRFGEASLATDRRPGDPGNPNPAPAVP